MPPRRGRQRIGQAARKIAQQIEAQRADESSTIGMGVQAVAREIVGEVEAGSLYWRAPLTYVAEQIAPRVARSHGVSESDLVDLTVYLLSGLQEFLVSMVADFDAQHFAAWTEASRSRGRTGG